MWENMGNNILEMIVEWFRSGVEIFLEIMDNILLDYDGLAGIALDAYNLFVFISGLLLVILCLSKVITMLLSEADGSQEANAWGIILDTIKAGLWLVMAPFIVSVMMRIVKILTDFFMEDISNSLMEAIERIASADTFKEVNSSIMVNLFIWVFVAVVVAFFVIKTFISHANIIMLLILSPVVAVSQASDNFDFTETWSRDLLSHAVTIIVLAFSMALFVETITATYDSQWGMYPMFIGSGALVISGPTLVKNLWFSSGASRAGQSAFRMLMMRR